VRSILIFNRERCLACRACELACSVAHSQSGQLETAIAEELPPKRRVTVAARTDGIEALRCEQCAEPLCASVARAARSIATPSAAGSRSKKAVAWDVSCA